MSFELYRNLYKMLVYAALRRDNQSDDEKRSMVVQSDKKDDEISKGYPRVWFSRYLGRRYDGWLDFGIIYFLIRCQHRRLLRIDEVL